MLDSTLVLRFLLVLTRIGAVLVFIPIPGVKAVPPTAKAVFLLTLTAALYPCWPALPVSAPGPGLFAAWLAQEAFLGIGLGVIVAFLAEAFSLATQIIGLQAGYSYASTIDPGSDADSPVLSVLAQIGANLLFFAFGMDRIVLRALIRSLELWPPGGPALSSEHFVTAVLHQGAAMLETGVRLALPIAGFLILLDVTLALLGRLQNQLQLLTLAFPLKMLAALALLVILLPAFIRLYRDSVEGSAHAISRALGA